MMLGTGLTFLSTRLYLSTALACTGLLVLVGLGDCIGLIHNFLSRLCIVLTDFLVASVHWDKLIFIIFCTYRYSTGNSKKILLKKNASDLVFERFLRKEIIFVE